MAEINTEVNFFDYLENYYQKVNTVTKTKWKTSPNISISSSHLALETILIEHKGTIVHASTFKLPRDDSEVKKIIEQNNYTN